MDSSRLSRQDLEALNEQQRQPTIQNYGQRNIGAERFPLVSTLAKFLRVVGFLLVVGGLAIFLFEFLPWITCQMLAPSTSPGFTGMPASCPVSYVQLVGGVTALVFGLGLVAFGELLGMFRSIEGNTYNTMKAVHEADYKARLAQGS